MVVIIGILAAIAIPKFANTKQKAYVATVKTDLRNLVTAEEAYFSDNMTYTTTTANLNYNVSAGNTVTVGSANGTGWSATAKNNADDADDLRDLRRQRGRRRSRARRRRSRSASRAGAVDAGGGASAPPFAFSARGASW